MVFCCYSNRPLNLIAFLEVVQCLSQFFQSQPSSNHTKKKAVMSLLSSNKKAKKAVQLLWLNNYIFFPNRKKKTKNLLMNSLQPLQKEINKVYVLYGWINCLCFYLTYVKII